MTAAMVAAGVAALTMLVIVVVAADVRVVAEISGQQRMDSRVGITADTAEEPDARLAGRVVVHDLRQFEDVQGPPLKPR